MRQVGRIGGRDRSLEHEGPAVVGHAAEHVERHVERAAPWVLHDPARLLEKHAGADVVGVADERRLDAEPAMGQRPQVAEHPVVARADVDASRHEPRPDRSPARR